MGSPGLVGFGSLPLSARSPLVSPLLHPSPPIAAAAGTSSMNPFPPALHLPSTAEAPDDPQWFFTLKTQDEEYRLRARTRDDMHDWMFAFQRSTAFLIDRILKDRQTARRKSGARRGSNAFDGRGFTGPSSLAPSGIGMGLRVGAGVGDGLGGSRGHSRTNVASDASGEHQARGRLGPAAVLPPHAPFLRSSSDGISRSSRDGGLHPVRVSPRFMLSLRPSSRE